MTKRILLIDDEPDFTELTSTLLRFHNFEVDAFNEAVNIDEIIKNNHYQLVVTDLMMPHLDGFELVKRLRGLKEYEKVPIIVLSAKTLTDLERKFLLQKETSFVPKPFEPHQLVDQITQLLGE